MSNKEKLVWALFGGLLVLLFLMSSTDLIIKEQEPAVYPISVIIRRDRDSYYENFRRGMDQAALEFNADVSFITLYESNDEKQQLELVRREIRDGAKAVILEPVDKEETLTELEELRPACPVIFLGAPAIGEAAAGAVVTDGAEIGRLLAEAVTEHVEPQIPVHLFCEGVFAANNEEIYEAAGELLAQAGYRVSLWEREDSDTYRRAIEETVYPGTGPAAIVALDTQALEEAAAILEGSAVYQSKVGGLFGVGITTRILGGLDRGVVTGVVTWNEFNEGYLCVKKAVMAARGEREREETLLPCYYLEREDMWDERYEKMLYPIE